MAAVHLLPDDTGGEVPILIPDGIEPLVGWRGWNVENDGPDLVLTGVTHAERWEPGVVSAAACMVYRPTVEIELHNIPEEDFAECDAAVRALVDEWAARWTDPHEPPNEGCHCGLYARSRREDIENGSIYGRIEAWGKIVKGAYGFRAEYARVTGLLLDHSFLRELNPATARNHERDVRKLATRYGVPIIDDDTRTPVHDLRPELRGPEPWAHP